MVSLAAFASLLWTFARRLGYPYDLEWMEGSMLLHAARLRQGLPLYAPPSLSFTAFAYPPLQPAVMATVSALFGLSYATGRALSIAGFLAALGCGFAFLREAGTPRVLALGGLALSAAAFAPTGAWYDLVRADSLWLGLLMGGLWAAWRARRSTRAAVVSGVLLTASLFAKQTAAPFLGVAALAVFLASPRRGLALGAVAGGLAVAGVLLLQWTTGGWFWTYAVALQGRGDFDRWLGFVLAPLRVLLLLGPAMALVVAALPSLWRAVRSRAIAPADGALVAALGMFGAALVATIRGAGPPWGYFNAFIPGVFFGGILLALASARFAAAGGGALAPVVLALSVLGAPGGLVWVADRLWPSAGIALPTGYDPRTLVPSAADRRAGDLLAARLRATPGRVFVPFHPFYAYRAGKEMTLHAQNLADTNAIPGLGTPQDLVEAIRSRRFDLLVLDVEGAGPAGEAEAMAQFPRLAGNYAIAERIDGPPVVSGAPVRPRLVLVPRP